MAQWINLHWNNSFVNWTRLPLLCKKSGAILLVLVGPTAGWQSDEILEVFKILYRSHRIFRVFNEGTVLLPSRLFRVL